MVTALIGTGGVRGKDVTGTIRFGTTTLYKDAIQIKEKNAIGIDNLGNTWTINTIGTTKFSSTSTHCQLGTIDFPAKDITLTMTLPQEQMMKSVSFKFAGSADSSTGQMTIKIDDSEIGKSAVEGNAEATASFSTKTVGKTITINITNIKGGIKCYYIKYTYAPRYIRATTCGNYGTICLPATVMKEDLEGATMYNIGGVINTGEEVSGIVLVEETGDMEAGKPYIFRATSEALNATLTGEEVSEPIPATGLVGNLGNENITVEDGNYILSGNLFHLIDGATATIGPNRAYIDLTSVNEYQKNSEAKALYFNFDGNITDGIKFIHSENNTYYDITGRPVLRPNKGIYIVNGKKICY